MQGRDSLVHVCVTWQYIRVPVVAMLKSRILIQLIINNVSSHTCYVILVGAKDYAVGYLPCKLNLT